jgi:hypothetical protein
MKKERQLEMKLLMLCTEAILKEVLRNFNIEGQIVCIYEETM